MVRILDMFWYTYFTFIGFIGFLYLFPADFHMMALYGTERASGVLTI